MHGKMAARQGCQTVQACMRNAALPAVAMSRVLRAHHDGSAAGRDSCAMHAALLAAHRVFRRKYSCHGPSVAAMAATVCSASTIAGQACRSSSRRVAAFAPVQLARSGKLHAEALLSPCRAADAASSPFLLDA